MKFHKDMLLMATAYLWILVGSLLFAAVCAEGDSSGSDSSSGGKRHHYKDFKLPDMGYRYNIPVYPAPTPIYYPQPYGYYQPPPAGYAPYGAPSSSPMSHLNPYYMQPGAPLPQQPQYPQPYPFPQQVPQQPLQQSSQPPQQPLPQQTYTQAPPVGYYPQQPYQPGGTSTINHSLKVNKAYTEDGHHQS